MEDKHQVRLGAVQETLFIPLAARARETQRKHPVLHDPKAVQLVQSIDYDAAKYGRGVGRLGHRPAHRDHRLLGPLRSWPRIPPRRSWSSAPA